MTYKRLLIIIFVAASAWGCQEEYASNARIDGAAPNGEDDGGVESGDGAREGGEAEQDPGRVGMSNGSRSDDAPEPCVEVTSDRLDFGETPLGGLNVLTTMVYNCSEDIVLGFGGAAVVSGAESFFLAEDGFWGGLEPGQGIEVEVAFAPESLGSHEGRLSIEVGGEQVEVALLGVGQSGRCPEAVARARVPDLPWGTALEVGPLATVELDGSLSSDPDNPEDPNAISRYVWTIVERPTDSATQLVPNASVVNPTLFVDLAGRYVIELQVFDVQDASSCAVATVTINAVPREDIHIQLVWNTPGDSNQNDVGLGQGTDMDLHVLHPRGNWNSPSWDCHWKNIEPEWGEPGGHDDPSLDIDDTDGRGPENINLNNPEEVSYDIGVHYFSDHGFGLSFATVRIYVRQVLVYEHRDKELEGTGVFWDVADLEWPSGEVSTVDRLYDGFP